MPKLQMHQIAVECDDSEQILITQGEGAHAQRIRITVEQVSFLVELLYSIKSQIEEQRYQRGR